MPTGVDVEERRRTRSGAVGGLALLVGGTAVAAVAGGAHSTSSSVALGILACALTHSLLDEIRRQARRRSPGWTPHDTVSTLALGAGALVALALTLLDVLPLRVRVVGGGLAVGYAAVCLYYYVLRRRAVHAAPTPAPVVAADPGAGLP